MPGFTLIELLVVIAIISMLASVILGSLNSARTKAQISALASGFHNLQLQIELARDLKNDVLGKVTNNWCTMCNFVNGQDIMTQPAALQINNNSWIAIGFAEAPKDPWGRPFILDENEGEAGYFCQYNDQLYSAGRDGIFESHYYDQNVSPGLLFQAEGDDYMENVSFLDCPGRQ